MDTDTDQPEATEEEQEQATGERRDEEEAMRYPGHDDPERVSETGEDGV
jgi:hypothetical protein